MKICITVENSYPFVNNDQADWIHFLLREIYKLNPDIEFFVFPILNKCYFTGKYKYTLPLNTRLYKPIILDNIFDDKDIIYTNDIDKILNNLIFKKGIEWNFIFEVFKNSSLRAEDIIFSDLFYEIAKKFHELNLNLSVFSEFLKMFQSIFGQMFTVLCHGFPRADIYHAISNGYAGLAACFAAYSENKPLILTELENYFMEKKKEISRQNITGGIYKFFLENHYNLITKCVESKASLISVLSEQSLFLLPKRKAVIVPNKAILKTPPRENDSYINISIFYGLFPDSHTKSIILGFNTAKKYFPSIRLLIFGDRNINSECYRQCKGLLEFEQINDVFFMDDISLEEKLKKTDIALFVLKDIRYGAPFSLIQSCSKPCIILTSENESMSEEDIVNEVFAKIIKKISRGPSDIGANFPGFVADPVESHINFYINAYHRFSGEANIKTDSSNNPMPRTLKDFLK